MIEFFRYDRWDNYIGAIADITSAVFKQEAGGESSVTLTTKDDLTKGDRIVWCDDQGIYHEHVANEPSATRDGDGKVVYEIYCEDALNELFRDKVDEVRIRGGTAATALTRILEETRWEVGTVTVTGTKTKSFYRISAGEALQNLVSTWGGEAYSSFTVDEFGVTHRYVNLVEAMGSRNTHKRFEYGKDLVSIKRTISADDVYTAMRGYGKGDDLDDDDDSTNGRRITFADINDGKDYVEDLDALELWGRPDGNGGKAHSFGTVIFSDCEDEEELLELTQAELDDAKTPKVSYECEVQDLASMGFSYEGISVGDDVQVIDTTFEPALELEARVVSIEKNLLDAEDSSITIGNIRSSLSSELADINFSLSSIRGQSSAWDAATTFGETYLQRIIDSLNAQFDAMGSYLYFSFELGLIVSSVPLDDEGKPTSTPASAINLRGGGFRIASTVDADGSFDWRTFGTGEGFVADYIVAGSLVAGLVNTGVLLVGDENDPTLMANFDSGEVVIKGTSVTIGATNAEEAIAETQSSITLLEDNITAEVSSLQSDLQSSITLLEDSITAEVSSLQAKLTQYGTCSTAASTAIKVVTVSSDDFTLSAGVMVSVYFTYANTASNPRLNINNTGSRYIYVGSSLITSDYYWVAGTTVTFIYTGSSWQVCDSGSLARISLAEDEIELRVEKGTLSSSISAEAGLITITSNRFSWESTYSSMTQYGVLTAASATLSGTFTCGDTSSNAITLSSNGQVVGYYQGEQAGFIDFASKINNVDTGESYLGIRIQTEGSLRISSPRISTAATSDTSETTTLGITETFTFTHVDSILESSAVEGLFFFYLRDTSFKFINGICTNCWTSYSKSVSVDTRE